MPILGSFGSKNTVFVENLTGIIIRCNNFFEFSVQYPTTYLTRIIMKRYVKQEEPYVVPTIDNMVIEEHIGIAANGNEELSLTHMMAPPFWMDLHQRPEFEEIIIMIKGKMIIDVDGESVELKEGQTLTIQKLTRVQFSNPFSEPNEYWSICTPAYTVETVNKEDWMLNQ